MVWMSSPKGAVQGAGLAEKDVPDIVAALKRTAGSVGGGQKMFPALSVPEKHFPHEWSPNACPRFRDDIARIGAKHGVAGVRLPFALAFAIAFLIGRTRHVLPPAVGIALALDIMLGVSKMPPLVAPDRRLRSTEVFVPPQQSQAPKPTPADHSA
jgi:hypothetical protein